METSRLLRMIRYGREGDRYLNIGIIGAGNVGLGMGAVWAAGSHRVCFSFSRRPDDLSASLAAGMPEAVVGSPEAAAEFGQVVLLAIHWPQVPELVGRLSGQLAGKPLLTCVVPWNSSRTGLNIGRDSSAAEEIGRLAPGALVVEALPLLADWLYLPPCTLSANPPTIFHCGDDSAAKETVASLLGELDLQPVDAGDLTAARLLEPAAALLWRIGTARGGGTNIALKLLRLGHDEGVDLR